MNTHIDFEKSIRKSRLIYKGTFMERLKISLRNLFIGILALIVSLAMFIYVYIYFGDNQLAILLATLPVLLILISMILINKLVKVEGTELRRNQSEIVRLLLSRYPGIQRHNCSERMLVITKGPRTSVFDKEILILLEDTHVYLNISMLGGGQWKYVFFSIPNYLRSRAVLRNFYQKIREPAFTPVRLATERATG